MKKSLVALAALAVAGVASAQSSVTLFGVVDAAVSGYSTKSNLYYTNPFAVPFGVPGSLKRSQTALSNSGYNSSRLGFRGTEDLGGGLAASFWLEAPITNDDGKTGAASFSRRSTVSLSGGFGEIRLGRDYTATFWNDTVFDPFGTVGVGANAIFRTNLNLASGHGGTPNGAAGSDSYVRTSNAVAYFLPPNLGGFYGQFQYALHENVKSNEVIGSPSKKGRYIGGRFGYANGPLDVAAAYGIDTKDSLTDLTVAGKDRLKTFNLGASYDFGPVKLFGELSQVKDAYNLSSTVTLGGFPYLLTQGVSNKYNGALIGATIPVGPGLIRASYSAVKYKPDSAITPFNFYNNGSSRASQFAVGYVHNLSKRTALYATLSRITIKDGQNNAGIMGITTSGGAPGYGTIAGQVYAPKSATGYDFGIRHAF